MDPLIQFHNEYRTCPKENLLFSSPVKPTRLLLCKVPMVTYNKADRYNLLQVIYLEVEHWPQEAENITVYIFY